MLGSTRRRFAGADKQVGTQRLTPLDLGLGQLSVKTLGLAQALKVWEPPISHPTVEWDERKKTFKGDPSGQKGYLHDRMVPGNLSLKEQLAIPKPSYPLHPAERRRITDGEEARRRRLGTNFRRKSVQEGRELRTRLVPVRDVCTFSRLTYRWLRWNRAKMCRTWWQISSVMRRNKRSTGSA